MLFWPAQHPSPGFFLIIAAQFCFEETPDQVGDGHMTQIRPVDVFLL